MVRNLVLQTERLPAKYAKRNDVAAVGLLSSLARMIRKSFSKQWLRVYRVERKFQDKSKLLMEKLIGFLSIFMFYRLGWSLKCREMSIALKDIGKLKHLIFLYLNA